MRLHLKRCFMTKFDEVLFPYQSTFSWPYSVSIYLLVISFFVCLFDLKFDILYMTPTFIKTNFKSFNVG